MRISNFAIWVGLIAGALMVGSSFFMAIGRVALEEPQPPLGQVISQERAALETVETPAEEATPEATPKMSAFILAQTGETRVSGRQPGRCERNGLIGLQFALACVTDETTRLSLRSGEFGWLGLLEGHMALEHVEGRFGKLGSVDALASLPALTSLVLIGTDLEDEAALARLTGLTELSLASSRVVDISFVRQMPGLKRLVLSDTPVSDLAPLSGHPALEELHIAETAVRDLAPLADLPKLRNLDLRDVQTADLAPLLAREELIIRR